MSSASGSRITAERLNKLRQALIGVGGVGSIPTVFYITNNVPYIDRLERGSSKQQPSGMVRVTVLEFRPIVAAVTGKIIR
jgi:hypothetical protein